MLTDTPSALPVGELNRRVRLSLEREFPLLWVAGEVSNLTRASSGHLYFSLKDENAQARCVMFRSRSQAIPWKLENGQQVEVRALVSLYEARGEFQLAVEGIRRAGLGRLFEAYARLKQALEAENLFALERKKRIPRFPSAIGIVSSPQAAALRDVLTAVARRAGHLPMILYPTSVQGDGAAESIASAIATAGSRAECGVLLIVRGGGSIEDLWAFNDEVVARAIATCPLPTICGIGHESDTTIADLVADLRAATPTAAAEIATQGWQEASDKVNNLAKAVRRIAELRLANAHQTVDHFSLRLIHPSQRLRMAVDRLTLLASRMHSSLSDLLGKRRVLLSKCEVALHRRTPRTEPCRSQVALWSQRLESGLRRQQTRRLAILEQAAGALHHLNPSAILARGFAVVRDQNGQVISNATDLALGQHVNLHLASGEADAEVIATRPA